MNDFVYALIDGLAYRSDSSVVTMARGTVWAGDDPFVAERPDLFSETPSVVHNTTGAVQVDAPPLEAKRGKRSRRG